MYDHVANRKVIIDQLRRELVGPDPAGKEVKAAEVLAFSSWNEYRGPYLQEDGEEILVDQTPTQRYGVGVLFPQSTLHDEESFALEGASASIDGEHIGTEVPARSALVQANGRTGASRKEDDFSTDIDLTPANALSPSSMAISFLAGLGNGGKVTIRATGGRYRSKDVAIREPGKKEQEKTIWLRKPVALLATFPVDLLLGDATQRLLVFPGSNGQIEVGEATNLEGLSLEVEVFSRPTRELGQRLLTVCMVNRTQGRPHASKNASSLFQSHFEVTIQDEHGTGCILPYPSPLQVGDDEQVGLDMLYRNIPVFATGHGCAADWVAESGSHIAARVSAECFPTVTLPQITPIILDENGKEISVGMGELCSLDPGNAAWGRLESLVSQYESWIDTKTEEAKSPYFPEKYRGAATQNLNECRKAVARMRAGLDFLKDDPMTLKAFQLANEAMLRQQVASRMSLRFAKYDKASEGIVFSDRFVASDLNPVESVTGAWRPFQIAFLLSSIESTGQPESIDHDLVELIWFPTGGGKTEAYLGLAAFSMFLRRLRNPDDVGVNVLMRYTLRLLTTQQFERASSLICAMERIRSANSGILGTEEFSIGIWLGGETTPNRRTDAIAELGILKKDKASDNPFLINKCPWCGAFLGRIDVPAKGKGRHSSDTYVLGYSQKASADGGESIVIHCPDEECPFYSRLPVLVVDEDVYASTPSLVIGTVDKFARLTWDDRPRRLFGIEESGERFASPPQLIIQDELHLISGPLGSLSGLLEPVVEELCTDRRDGRTVHPKIICSTATTRRFRDQILGLYGRTESCLFPPPGLDAGDSFFARTDTSTPGRIYAGVHAPGFGSYQTEWVRALTALVNAPMQLTGDAERDPWWTLLMFCNSLRDMGTAHTLLNTDVLDYSVTFWQRRGTTKDRKRYISNANSVLELTGGLKRSQIKEALDALQTPVESSGRTVDVCLATNIIEVGVDIPRLSLMTVAGQPKTTAQYIQATGRVGRTKEKPGLVVTFYGPSKARDRSHFERFRAYHERLYAQVEPTSVTPFSPPALLRFLHSALIAYVRQNEPTAKVESPFPMPELALREASKVLRRRVELVDQSELGNFDVMTDKILDEWSHWERKDWDRAPEGEYPLLRHAGSYASAQAKEVSWSTMDSLRNVDAECHGEITHRYLNHLASMEMGAESE